MAVSAAHFTQLAKSLSDVQDKLPMDRVISIVFGTLPRCLKKGLCRWGCGRIRGASKDPLFAVILKTSSQKGIYRSTLQMFVAMPTLSY